MGKKNEILVIGDYTEWQTKMFKEFFESFFLTSTLDIKNLSIGLRERIEAVAFKGHSELGEEEFKLLPKLKLISNFGVGFDTISIVGASKCGVTVTNTPNVLNDDVADLAIGLLIGLSRRFADGTNWIRSGNWEKFGEMPLNHSISKRRVGIIGLGRIGYEIANRLERFKCEIHYYSRSVKKCPPSWKFYSDAVSLAQEVEIIFVTLVGGRETVNFVNSEVLDALGVNGFVINVSRGSTVDELALLDVLESRKIRGAGLDVFYAEPKINRRFLQLDNVLIQPHQGSGTFESRRAMSELQIKNLKNYFSGIKLVTPVN
ncbi:MAG: 2-hydroxyacid dehydrogenase [Pseudomonadota bacterium]|nr:2-hydroxyacid dehydrogenase [Pseudomonadota bacterium]